ncbi:hypothetical protein FSP39_020874 [Pinctada imbricata]|uniref:Fibrinogen C-terminal domain-containing protein n=1 Tax=Pinctada imbricata TaxID=66713 RepID=A0AA89BWA8_PINIB|nr:hypothetical protein FSP39_020874 [Pinctada imbricata]
MDINGGGWTVFQKRFDGSVGFYRTFEEYKYGFGNASGEYWLGNEYVHYITTKRNCSLRIDLWDWLGKTAHNIYSVFWIDSEQSEYTLHVKGVQGNAGGMFIAHNGQMFSASDRDNDRWSGSCAQHYMGGWWFGICYYSNLNGLYRRPGGSYGFNTTSTLGWRDNAFKIKSLKATRMMIKRRN